MNISLNDLQICFVIPPKEERRSKPSGLRRWASGSKATTANSVGAYSNRLGLATTVRLRVCGLQAYSFAPDVAIVEDETRAHEHSRGKRFLFSHLWYDAQDV